MTQFKQFTMGFLCFFEKTTNPFSL